MPKADLGKFVMDYRDEGDPAGAPVVLIHALGCDLHLWDDVVARLPGGLRLVRYSLRGHGDSGVLPAPYAMGALVRDAERLLDHLAVRDAVVVGLSIGGLIAQGLAIKRLDQVRALVLSNTAARIGNPGLWEARIAQIRAAGLDSVADATLARWFPAGFRATAAAQACRARLVSTPIEGYLGCAAAIGGADFLATTAGLRLPLLGIAGSEDGSVPPDMVRETCDLVPGSRFHLLRGAGHLPCVDAPEGWAQVVAGFLKEIGHS